MELPLVLGKVCLHHTGEGLNYANYFCSTLSFVNFDSLLGWGGNWIQSPLWENVYICNYITREIDNLTILVFSWGMLSEIGGMYGSKTQKGNFRLRTVSKEFVQCVLSVELPYTQISKESFDTSTFTHTCTRMHIHGFSCRHTHTHTLMHISAFVRTHTHTHTHTHVHVFWRLGGRQPA